MFEEFRSRSRRFLVRFPIRPLLTVLLLGAAFPVLAQDSNFGTVTVSRGASEQVNGRTGGATSLPAIVRDRDVAGNLCLGFATSTPDAVVVLSQDMPSITLQVDSGGNDTTLVVQGPGGVRCGDDTGRNKDASVRGTNWRAGTYRVWVGTIDSGARYSYTLTVGE